MDAAEHEGDVQLQKAASGLLADFDASLRPFLWRTQQSGKSVIRRRVRIKEKDRLLRLLSPFQELPQLLDPHLQNFLPALAEAYLESLRHSHTSKKPLKNATLLVPLSAAICELLYTFCKIRGEKVVVRFLNAETRYLELLLSALEEAESAADGSVIDTRTSSGPTPWAWEERYVCLLWLSHLLLAPFDLATISSAGTAGNERPDIPGLNFPDTLPGVAIRIVPVAIKYLASAGKERDAAKVLLVRISMRKDMQEICLLHSLVQWALLNFQDTASANTISTYHSVGILSFLGGLLVSSANTSDMNPYLIKIFRTMQAISEEETPAFKSIHSSALARKMVIKIMRAIAVISLQPVAPLTKPDMERAEVVEVTIGHLLEALADNDTPVRLAASKALSIITLKLAPVMASQVIDAVLESLTHNVLWISDTTEGDEGKTRDLSAVNPLEWHGLILTLSHLLYRRSPPPESLSKILSALLIGLSFERRSTSGSSVGTNVRDAACFGIWALARRYTTAELWTVSIPSAYHIERDDSLVSTPSVIQVLATELVICASLDPAGNIRRGASAALQELIGRHPDTVAEGIAAVQVVDYHAVALRSRAMLEVAPKAAPLSKYYQIALLSALRSWRGIGDGDPASRRNAATAIGLLARGLGVSDTVFAWDRLIAFTKNIDLQLSSLAPRQSDQRHGLLLSIAAVMSSVPDIIEKYGIKDALGVSPRFRETIDQMLKIVIVILGSAKSLTDRRTDMVAEGISRLILAACAILRIDSVIRAFINKPSEKLSEDEVKNLVLLELGDRSLQSGTSSKDTRLFEVKCCLTRSYASHQSIITAAAELLMTWLRRTEKDVVEAATEAAASLISIVDDQQRSTFVGRWIHEVLDDDGRLVPGYILALAGVFEIVTAAQQEEICDAILHRWKVTSHIEGKVIILLALTRGHLLCSRASSFVNVMAEGLDDYTTDGRGDVGSLVRVEALRAVRKIFNSVPRDCAKNRNEGSELWFEQAENISTLYRKVLRLSAEKLDRVRIEAQQTLAQVCGDSFERQRFEKSGTSSFDYFRWLLELQGHDWLAFPLSMYHCSHWCLELFEGLVSSADAGSEDLIRVSRAALADFCERETLRAEIFQNKLGPKSLVCDSLFEVAKRNITNDRVLVPALEVMGFLFDAGIMQQSNLQWRSLYMLVQEAHYKTGNVRKLEASIKVYGGLLQVYPEALKKLSSMLLHPFPKIRNQVADVLFVARGVGKGINWTKARKEDLEKVKEELRRQNIEA